MLFVYIVNCLWNINLNKTNYKTIFLHQKIISRSWKASLYKEDMTLCARVGTIWRSHFGAAVLAPVYLKVAERKV